MTVGELVCELKKYDPGLPVMFSTPEYKGFVRLISIEDILTKKSVLLPLGVRGLTAGELVGRLGGLWYLPPSGELYFITLNAEEAAIYNVDLSDDEIIVSGKIIQGTRCWTF